MTNIRQIGIIQLIIGILLSIFYTWLLLTNSMSTIESIFDILGFLILPAITLYFIISGVYSIFYLEILSWRIKKLRSSGVKATLKTDKIIYKTIKLPRYPYTSRTFSIRATGINPLTRKEQNFKSKPMSTYLLKNQKINTLIGSDIDVYIYKKNPNKYLVDIQEYLK